MSDTTMGGFVAPGFERVAEEFERNLTDRGDIGAAFAAEFDGDVVVDLWGGLADQATGRAWERDTLQLVFSGTKGFVAICLLVLVEREELALEDPVSKYWPEFAASGKADITVAEMVSHRARLPGLRARLLEADVTNDKGMADLLANQAPERDRRAHAMYHPLTYGWLCGELIRRVTRRSVGRFFADEVAGQLELDIWIGLPAEFEGRVTTLTHGPSWESLAVRDPDLVAADELLRRVWANPPLFESHRVPWNTRQFRAAEIPGANGIGTARSIARLYSCLACGGELHGVRILRPETIALGRRELSRFWDPFGDEPCSFGVGFELQTEASRLGPPASAFGHTGAGGSVHTAWPEEGVGASYVMNQMRECPAGDERSIALLRALHEAVHAFRKQGLPYTEPRRESP